MKTRVEIEKMVYDLFPMPKNCCEKRKEKIEKLRSDTIKLELRKQERKKEYK